LIGGIKLALFGGELGKLGGNLQGPYQEAWRAIVEGVEREGKWFCGSMRPCENDISQDRMEWTAQVINAIDQYLEEWPCSWKQLSLGDPIFIESTLELLPSLTTLLLVFRLVFLIPWVQ
jgi:hypothetical protein